MQHHEPSAFDALLAALAGTAPGRQRQLVDDWTLRHPVSPLIAADEAVIWYFGRARDVVLRGDMLGERSEALAHLPGTDLWFHRARYEPDARLDYHLLVDGQDMGDPRNPRGAPSAFGPRAELRMPSFHDAQLWQPRAGVPAGAISVHHFSSSLYPSTRRVAIYTPPGYSADARYACVVFHDGGDYLRFGGATHILNNLLAEGAIPPTVAVFVAPSSEHGRVADYDLNDRYAALICDELLPWLAERVQLHEDPRTRAIVGASFGGLIALYIAYGRPDRFGLVGSQSAYVGRDGDAIVRLFRGTERLPLRLHLIVGTYETEVGSLDRGAAEADFVRANRLLRDVLMSRGYPLRYAEYHDGHAWGFWRARLGDALRFLLG